MTCSRGDQAPSVGARVTGVKQQEVLLAPVLHHSSHVTHAAHVPVVQRLPVLQRERGEVRVLLEEDQISPQTELNRLGQQTAGEALADGGQVTRLADEVPDLSSLVAHHWDGVV